MQSDYARDLSDPDQPIHDAARERGGKALRIRIQPMILRENGAKGGQYRSWKEVRWTLECDSPAEAFACRDAMKAFFDTLARLGPAVVSQALGAMNVVNQAGEAAHRKGHP